MNVSETAGGIVVNARGEIALVRRRSDTLWFFPKGHVEEREALEDAALREIREETGLTELEYLDTLAPYERPSIEKDGSYSTSELKRVHMFLYATREESLVPSMEITDTTWVSLSHVAEQLEDTKDRAWFITVFKRVQEAIQRD